METGGTISVKKLELGKCVMQCLVQHVSCCTEASTSVLTEVRGNLVSADSSASSSWVVYQPLIQWKGVVFFRVPGMVLCFGARRKTTLITHRCLQLLLSSVVQRQGCSQQRAQGAGREQSEDSWLKLAKGIFSNIWPHVEGILNGVHLSLFHCSGTIACASTCYIHSYYIYTHTYLYP